MSKEIKGIKFLSVTIDFYCVIPDGSLNLGLVRLEHEGRAFELDTVRSTYIHENDHTVVEIELEVDEEVSEGCKFDLTALDLFDNPDLKATIWFEEAVEVTACGEYVDPESQTLFVKHLSDENDGSGMTVAIDLEIEE